MDPSELARRLGAWSTGPDALYRQLADGVARLVAEGQLRRGDRLPAERALAAELAVARGTVVAAYDSLRADGVVERVQGSGTRVVAGAVGAPAGATAAVRGGDGTGGEPGTGAVVAAGAPLFATAPDTIDLLKAVPPISPVAREVLARTGLAADESSSGAVEPAGLDPVRRRIAAWYTDAGLSTSPGEILVTSGAQQAIALVVQRFVERDDVVLVEQLTWPGLTDVVRRQGARVHGIPLDADGVDVDELRAAVERLRPRMIALNPHHHNPTGTRLAPDRRRAVAELAADHGVLLVEDRVAAPLAFDGVVPPPLATHRPDAATFTIDSLSKTVWSGLRIGWIRTDAASVQALRTTKALADLWTAIPSQMLALELFDHLGTSVRERVDALRDGHRTLVAALAERLPAWELATVRGGMVVAARLPSGSASDFARFATRFGVAVASGREFSTTTVVDDLVRVPFTLPEATLREAVDRLAAAWATFPRRRLDEPTEHPAIV